MISRGFLYNHAGHIHFSMKSLVQNFGGIADSLIAGPYLAPALIPRSPWLDAQAPEPPQVRSVLHKDKLIISWAHADPTDVFHWVIYLKRQGQWEYKILNRMARTYTIPLPSLAISKSIEEEKFDKLRLPISHIAISAVDRLANESTYQIHQVLTGTTLSFSPSKP